MDEKERRLVSVFEDDEIPYEVRMKHLIEGYRRDLKRLDQLARYAKGLEEENLLLQRTGFDGKTLQLMAEVVLFQRLH